MEEEPRAGPHKFIRVEVYICRSSQLLQFLRRSPFPHWGSGGGGGGILQIAERQTTSKFSDKS